jgi:type 1 glutamine amidotransferase
MKTLIIQGGWPGHEPERTAALFGQKLRAEGHSVEISDSLEALDDASALTKYDLISPCWTMGQISPKQSKNLSAAVRSGTGLAGFHGGMGDAFRGDVDYEWMVGGHFVGHPHVGAYELTVRVADHPATRHLPAVFRYESEQYYMLVDPGIRVLVDTVYEHEGRSVTMPAVWTKQWGQGRVFYSALGHEADEFTRYPAVAEMTLAGMKWATRKN